jgi:hypothetical protein
MLEKLHELQAQAKLWATQTRTTAQTEVKILLAKVDDYLTHVGLAERRVSEHEQHIRNLLLGKQQLHTHLSTMVPAKDLHAANEEKSKADEKIADLSARLHLAQEENEKLKTTALVSFQWIPRQNSNQNQIYFDFIGKLQALFSVFNDHLLYATWQGMVPRSELLEALSQAKANKDDADSKAKDLAWLEEQMKKSQEQLAAARQEAASLRAEVGGMVPRSELEATAARLAESQAAAREAQAKQQETMSELNGRLIALEKEKSENLVKMQVKLNWNSSAQQW